ncbi:MAG: hypothetical protein IJ202_04565 [Bacteroidales bacterium]|nr:hypothetical protein [Bacteroidales bacterium]
MQKTITKQGDRYVSFDVARYNELSRRLDDLEKLLPALSQALKKVDYPTDEKWQLTIMRRGTEGLVDLVRRTAKEAAKRLGVDHFLTESWQEVAVSRIDPEVRKTVDELHRFFTSTLADLPLKAGEIHLDEYGALVVEAEKVRDRMRESLTVPLPDDIAADAGRISRAAKALRELEEKGYDAVNLVKTLAGSYMAQEQYLPLDDEAFLVYMLNGHRHATLEEMERDAHIETVGAMLGVTRRFKADEYRSYSAHFTQTDTPDGQSVPEDTATGESVSDDIPEDPEQEPINED